MLSRAAWGVESLIRTYGGKKRRQAAGQELNKDVNFLRRDVVPIKIRFKLKLSRIFFSPPLETRLGANRGNNYRHRRSRVDVASLFES